MITSKGLSHIVPGIEPHNILFTDKWRRIQGYNIMRDEATFRFDSFVDGILQTYSVNTRPADWEWAGSIADRHFDQCEKSGLSAMHTIYRNINKDISRPINDEKKSDCVAPELLSKRLRDW